MLKTTKVISLSLCLILFSNVIYKVQAMPMGDRSQKDQQARQQADQQPGDLVEPTTTIRATTMVSIREILQGKEYANELELIKIILMNRKYDRDTVDSLASLLAIEKVLRKQSDSMKDIKDSVLNLALNELHFIKKLSHVRVIIDKVEAEEGRPPLCDNCLKYDENHNASNCVNPKVRKSLNAKEQRIRNRANFWQWIFANTTEYSYNVRSLLNHLLNAYEKNKNNPIIRTKDVKNFEDFKLVFCTAIAKIYEIVNFFLHEYHQNLPFNGYVKFGRVNVFNEKLDIFVSILIDTFGDKLDSKEPYGIQFEEYMPPP